MDKREMEDKFSEVENINDQSYDALSPEFFDAAINVFDYTDPDLNCHDELSMFKGC